MAPLRVRCVVSFSSQDPKYPVENLLLEERVQPWLCGRLDRSRLLRAELQLEQASSIGYIDVGNCGSAFLQIEVGRSSWHPGQDYLPLLPTTALMMPADAKLDRNRSGVRMFKEGDLLAPALVEKWDRVRLTCSQPFNRQAQFGLAFLRLRTPQDDSEETEGGPADPSPSQTSPSPSPKPGVSSGVFGGTLPPTGASSTGSEEGALLKSQLQRLDSALGKGLSPPGLSRPARLVLKAAASAHRRAPLLPAGSPPPVARSGRVGRAPDAAEASRTPGPKPEQSARSSSLKTTGRSGWKGSTRRPRNGPRKERRACSQRGDPPTWQSDEEEGGGGAVLGTCPICAGRFPAEVLPVHASACGEEADMGRASPSPVWGSWVECPICQGWFPASEVEGHAGGCGEEYA